MSSELQPGACRAPGVPADLSALPPGTHTARHAHHRHGSITTATAPRRDRRMADAGARDRAERLMSRKTQAEADAPGRCHGPAAAAGWRTGLAETPFVRIEVMR